MKPVIKLLPVLLMFFSLQTAIFAQSDRMGTQPSAPAAGTGFPGIEPDPKALDFFRRGEGPVKSNPGGIRNYSWTDLAEMSLWASGETAVSSMSAASGLERIRNISVDINSSPLFPITGEGRAEFILEYMHKNLLKTYSINQTGIDILLSAGRFNCVSSAVMYMILCKSAGLDVTGVVTRDHAFVSVNISGEVIDVETTNLYGFDPGSRREFHDQFGKLTGFTYVPARNYRDRQGISQAELVSLILWNRIVDLESGNRFGEAVSLAVDRTALLHGSKMAINKDSYSPLFVNPYQSLLDRIFNYGTFLLRAGREEDCLRWAALASPEYPDEKRWQDFAYAAANNRINKFMRSSQLSEAKNFLDLHRSLLSQDSYERLDVLLLDAELAVGVNGIRNTADGDKVITAIDEAGKSGKISGERSSQLLTAAVQKTAAIISAAPGMDWPGAIKYIENAISRFGPNRELDQALRVYQSNRAADFHNRFASAWNRGNYDEAVNILNNGLSEFPGDRRLLADRELVERNRR